MRSQRESKGCLPSCQINVYDFVSWQWCFGYWWIFFSIWMVLLWGWGILILCSIIQKVPPKTEVGGNQNLPQREGEQACFKITYPKSLPLDWRHWWGGRWAKKGKMWLRPCRLARQNADAVFRARATRSLGLPFHDGCVCLFVDYCLLIHVANLISIHIYIYTLSMQMDSMICTM